MIAKLGGYGFANPWESHFMFDQTFLLESSKYIAQIQRIHQSILNGTSTSPQSSSKNVLVTNPPVHFGFFLWTGQSTSPVQNTF